MTFNLPGSSINIILYCTLGHCHLNFVDYIIDTNRRTTNVVGFVISNLVTPSKSAQFSVELLSVQFAFIITLPVHPLKHCNVAVSGLEQ